MALLELLVAAARARVVATDILQGVAHRLLRGVVAVRTMDMTVVMVMMVMIMVVVAIRAMDMGLVHLGYSVIEAGIISPSSPIRTLSLNSKPVLSLPSRR
ncbi:hypothetical protein PS3A_56400 [Pseudomonas sp. 3A(2025)]